MMVTAVVRKREEKGEEEGGPTDQKEEGDTDTRSRSHEPPDNQPSQPSTSSLPSALSGSARR